jgi:hypothetical protein
MSNNRDWRQSIAGLAEHERRDAPTTLAARVAELIQVCGDARAMEQLSQREAPERWPWPESTLAFLREKAKAIYGE